MGVDTAKHEIFPTAARRVVFLVLVLIVFVVPPLIPALEDGVWEWVVLAVHGAEDGPNSMSLHLESQRQVSLIWMNLQLILLFLTRTVGGSAITSRIGVPATV